MTSCILPLPGPPKDAYLHGQRPHSRSISSIVHTGRPRSPGFQGYPQQVRQPGGPTQPGAVVYQRNILRMCTTAASLLNKSLHELTVTHHSITIGIAKINARNTKVTTFSTVRRSQCCTSRAHRPREPSPRVTHPPQDNEGGGALERKCAPHWHWLRGELFLICAGTWNMLTDEQCIDA